MATMTRRGGVRKSAMSVRGLVVQSVVRYVDIKPTKSGSMSGTVVHGILGKIIVLDELHRSISIDVV